MTGDAQLPLPAPNHGFRHRTTIVTDQQHAYGPPRLPLTVGLVDQDHGRAWPSVITQNRPSMIT